MTMTTKPTMWPLLACCISASACAGSPLQEMAENEPNVCGADEEIIDGEVYRIPHRYDFTGLSRALARDSDLAAASGVRAVKSCDDAQRVVEARYALAESDAPGDGFALETHTFPATEPGAAEALPIKLGSTSSGHRGAVEIMTRDKRDGSASRCSGILIGRAAALMSAHCMNHIVDPGGDNDVDTWLMDEDVIVNYQKNGTWYCVSSAAPMAGKCSAYRRMHLVQYGGYSGAGDAGDDIAVVVLPTGDWTNTTTADYLRVYTDTFAGHVSNYNAWGVGANSDSGSGSGVLRTANFAMDWFGTYHYISDVRTPRFCTGDSGSGAIITNGSDDYAIGLLSEAKAFPGDVCAMAGGKQRGTRLNQKIDWVEGWVSWIRPGTGYDCDPYSGSLGTYQRCW